MSDRKIRSSNPAARGEPHRFPALRGISTRRVVLVGGILAASFGCALVAASQSRPDLIAARLGIPGLGGSGLGVSGLTSETKASAETKILSEVKTSAGTMNLAGFQRRGNSLVGEVKTRDGAVVRLVFDARTHTLIGLRVLDPVEQPPREAEAVLACINQSSTAPPPVTPLTARLLPEAASPAN
jgi:hypothetical protein